MSYMTFSSQEQPLFQISEENSFMTPFLLCSYFRAHPTTLLLRILGGGRMHGPSPHLKFWGDRPPVPLSLRLCLQNRYNSGSYGHQVKLLLLETTYPENLRTLYWRYVSYRY